MALSARLQVRQTQSLVITPQLMQAIRLLQMSGRGARALRRRRAGAESASRSRRRRPRSSADEASEPTRARGPCDRNRRRARCRALPMSFPSRSAPMPAATPSSAAPRSGNAGARVRRFRHRPAASRERKPGSAARRERSKRSFADAPADRAIALALLAELDEAGYLTETAGRHRRAPRRVAGGGRARAPRLPGSRADRNFRALARRMPRAAACRARSPQHRRCRRCSPISIASPPATVPGSPRSAASAARASTR